LGERTRDDDRRARASIARAVDVVDSLDDSALQGLTILFCLWDMRRGAGSIDAGLDNYSRSLGEIGCDILPMGDSWLDHIDILGLARVDRSGAQTLKPFEEKLALTVPGYTGKGVHEDLRASVEDRFLDEAGVSLKLVSHELKPAYFRLPFSDFEGLQAALDRTPLDPEQRRKVLDMSTSEVGIKSTTRPSWRVFGRLWMPGLSSLFAGLGGTRFPTHRSEHSLVQPLPTQTRPALRVWQTFRRYTLT
jgi:hypothetical protein